MSVFRHARFSFLIALQWGNAIGVWSQVVAGQWVLVDAGHSATVVSLVPAFVSLPFLVLAIPLGAIVSHRPRELLMASAMGAAAIASGCAGVATALGFVHPSVVLTATAIIGIGLVAVGTAWQSLLPETVERSEISQAAVIDGATFNSARALGPVAAGIALAWIVPAWVFALNAALFALCAILMAWGGHRWPSTVGEREPLWHSVRSGLRFVRFSPWTRRLLMRLATFSVPAACLWSLLPVVAHDRLGFESLGLGITTGMLGAGAMLGTLCIASVRARMSVNLFAGIGTAIYAAGLVVMATSTSGPLVVAVMLPVGLAWVAVQSTWMMLSNQALPGWVRPRVIAIVLFVFQVTQALGAVLWGMVADLLGLTPAVLLAALWMSSAVYGFHRRGLRPAAGIEPEVVTSDEFDALDDLPGPVLAEFRYEVTPDRVEAFLDAMRELRRSRLRLGGQGWNLLEDPERPGQFIERIRFHSAADVRAQGRERLTVPEARVREQVRSIATAVSGPVLMRVVEVDPARNGR